MFESVFNTAEATLSVRSAVICTGVSLLCGLIIAICYYYTDRKRANRGFCLSLVVIPALVQAVIMMVNGNLGTGVAIMGAFTLVRFRSIPGSAREISAIFFTMVTGLAFGMGYLTYGCYVTVALCVVMLLVHFFPVRMRAEKMQSLKVTIYEDLDYMTIFDDLFREYLKSYDKVMVKTTNMGSMYQLQYNIEMKNPGKEKEFIDALRARNGNLTIICGNATEAGETL